MTIKEVTDKIAWQAFIESAQPSSFLHDWDAGEIERELGRTIFRLGVYKPDNDAGQNSERDSKLLAVALFVKVTARRGTFLLCPHGPIIERSALAGGAEAEAKLVELMKAIRDEASRLAKQEHCVFIRISTLVPNTPEHRKLFAKAGFRNAPIHMHSELAWILDIRPDEEALLSGMKKNTRYSIRKADKDGVTVRLSQSMADFETFWNIYMTTASRQHFTPFPRNYLEKEFELFFKDDKAVLFFAEYQGQPISTAFVVYSNGSGFYHHGASNNIFPGITPSEKVQWEAIKEAKRRGCSHYNFWGVVTDEETKHPWYGLSKFKKSFGGFSEGYVHAQDYVITSAYWLTYLIEKARKMKRRL